MKKKTLIIIAVLFITPFICLTANASTDQAAVTQTGTTGAASTGTTGAASTGATVTAPTGSTGATPTGTTGATVTAPTGSTGATTTSSRSEGLSFAEGCLVFSPVIFFLIILSFTIFTLRKNGVQLADLLVEKNATSPDASVSSSILASTVHQAATATATAAAAVPGATAPTVANAVASNPPSPTDQPVSATTPRSTSRLIALLSGLTTLAIGSCLCSFYIYGYLINPGSAVDFSKLTTVLITLGIGVLPYGFNQASAALKN